MWRGLLWGSVVETGPAVDRGVWRGLLWGSVFETGPAVDRGLRTGAGLTCEMGTAIGPATRRLLTSPWFAALACLELSLHFLYFFVDDEMIAFVHACMRSGDQEFYQGALNRSGSIAAARQANVRLKYGSRP